MIITVNGEPLEVPEGQTVAQLIGRLNLPVDGVAVAVERRVVPRSQHAETVLSERATVEIIRAVGGG